MKSKAKLLTLLILIILSTSAFDNSIFTIVPESQYVYLNNNVTFECATNLTGYTLTFSYGGSIAVIVEETNLPDGGIKVSTTFIVTSTLNGTTVGCRADHSVNTPMVTSLANVYAQGPPGSVSNLQGYQLDHCCIVFSWSPPFTLGQLSVWYQVTLSIGEEIMSSEVIYTTNYTYCPIDLTNGEYRLNITTMNGAGTGIWNSITTMFKTDKTLDVIYNNYLTYRQDNDWTYHFEITPSTQLCTQPIMNATVMSCNLKNSSDCYNSTNVNIIADFNEYKSIVSKIDLPLKEKFTTCIFLEYESGQIFQTTPVDTSSHDLQQLITTNTSNDILCLQFIFVNGSTINEVHLHLQCDHRLHLFDNEDLSRNNQLIFTQCFRDISPNNWTLYACDGPLPQGNKTCSNPAVILPDIIINGEVPSSSTVTSSTSSVSDSNSVLPTTSINIVSTTIPSTTNGLNIIGVITGSIAAILVITVIIVLLVCLNVLKKSIKKNHSFSIDEIDNICTLKVTSSCITQDSKNIHSKEMISQSEIRMVSFDGCPTIIKRSQEDPVNHNVAPTKEQDDNHEEYPITINETPTIFL